MSRREAKTSPTSRGRRSAYTLLEIIVVMVIAALLMGMLLPALSRSRFQARMSACQIGLQQLGQALNAYVVDNHGFLPYGPKAPPPSATNFYPLTGNVTSLLSLQNGAPVGMGLLLADYLNTKGDLLFCPGADEKWDTRESLALVGRAQVEGSYYYRHASVTTLSGTLPIAKMEVGRLGKNRKGRPIRCLVMDSQFLAPASLALFNLQSRTHHQRRFVNALHTDGHVSNHKNDNERFTVNIATSVYQTLDRILEVFESLDGK